MQIPFNPFEELWLAAERGEEVIFFDADGRHIVYNGIHYIDMSYPSDFPERYERDMRDYESRRATGVPHPRPGTEGTS